jgi:ribosome-associated toxin RatA of RatAB toxin-antitoxin module
MQRVDRFILVPYSVEQMFDLVADVAAYPQFLPWCAGASTQPRVPRGVQATLAIDYRGVRSRFTTHNVHVRPTSIRMDLVDGPFRTLRGQWHFHALRADACRVELHLHYEFAVGLLGRAIAPVFDGISTSLIDAFSQRADALYAG